MKAKNILLRAGRDPRQAELLEVCNWLKAECGSAANALLVIAAESPKYRLALRNMKRAKR